MEKIILITTLLIITIQVSGSGNGEPMTELQEIYSIPLVDLSGDTVTLENSRENVLLIVNTASECGFTPQLEGLEKIYQKYKEKGFEVLGFPCNQFAGQEPLEGAAIGAFCQKNYGVTFRIFSKIKVNGDKTHPLYKILKKSAPGIAGSEAIKWNFTKFLINRNASEIIRFAPSKKPEDLSGQIEAFLEKQD